MKKAATTKRKPAAVKRKTPAPTMKPRVTYSAEVGESILELYSDGLSLSEICCMPNMPTRRAVMNWLVEHEEFFTAFARAREVNAAAIADHIAVIERQVLAGIVDPAAARVALESKRWRARVLHPGQYGDKQEVKHSGSVGVSININLGDTDAG